MKAEKNALMRMETLINSDRMKNSDGFSDILTVDIDRVLKDYFEYKGKPQLEVAKTGNTFSVKITLTANGIRAFSFIPQER